MIIPYYRQETDYTCGPACLKMVFAYLGKETTEEELATLLKANPEWGTVTDDMSVVVSKLGFPYFEKKEAFIEDIKEFVSKEMPVIVDFIEPSEEDRHFSVVVGFEGDDLIFNDPWNGEGFKMPSEEFYTRWKSPENRYPKWMMAIQGA